MNYEESFKKSSHSPETNCCKNSSNQSYLDVTKMQQLYKIITNLLTC